MFRSSSRRDFLQLSTLALASAAAPRSLALAAADTIGTEKGKVARWVTDSTRRCAPTAGLEWQPLAGAASRDAIRLDVRSRFQPVLGFGAAFTDAACYMLQQLSPAARETLLHQLFHPSEMGFNVCRTCMGSSDYSTQLYSYDEGEPDPDLKRFSIEHDRQSILPILREARKVNPDIFLLSSPWSPPGWMKANGSMLGGSMRRKYMDSYAQYFLKFLRAYEAEGVPVQAVTTQNEVDTDQDGRMPACIWPQEYEADFVRKYLGPLFKRESVKTQIWLLDHNYNLWGRAICELEIPKVRDYANAIAWHGYMGEPEMMLKVQRAFPEVEMYWTEGGPDYTDPAYGTDWCKWSADFAGILRNGCRALTAWNFALDEQGRPNIGPFPCGGLVTIHSKTREITYSGQFWAFAHYSRFIRRGARRFDSRGAPSDVHHVAFENPDKSRVLVLANSGAARQVTVQSGENAASIRLEKNSVATLVW